MEISGIFGFQSALSVPMSEEQKEAMQEIMGKYDPENFTSQDMISMRRELLESGVPTSKECMQLMREAGFSTSSASETDDAASVYSQMETRKSELWDIYLQLQNGEIDESQFQSLIQGQVQSGSLIDYIS